MPKGVEHSRDVEIAILCLAPDGCSDRLSINQCYKHPTAIAFDQYEAYTPEKLELWDGFYDYGDPDDFKGFYLAVLTNMGLRAAVNHVPIAQWLAAIQEVALQNPKLDDALRDRYSCELKERCDRTFKLAIRTRIGFEHR